MSAKEVAIQDIKCELEKQGKSFLAFHTELDEVMDALVEEHSKKQLKPSKI